MKNRALAIGKFEGVHLGHQKLLAEVVRHAQNAGLLSSVMLFRPHPYIFFGDANYKPLFTHEEQEILLKNIGIDEIIYQNFDETFVALEPTDFCSLIFAELNAKLVIVGENYRFGKGRAGDTELLRNQAAAYGAEVQTISESTDGTLISTSGIRKLLCDKLPEANRQLGFSFFITGIVTRGKQLGRTLDFPTLNIYPRECKFLLADGVYVTKTEIDSVVYNSVTNIGLRPTVDSTSPRRSVETHLLDCNVGELYSAEVNIKFEKFIRTEKRFGSLDELKSQIAQDADLARAYHSL